MVAMIPRFSVVSLLVALTVLGFQGPSARAEDTLESALMPLIEAHKGKVAVAVKNLETGESFLYHADDADADGQPDQVPGHDRGLPPGGREEGRPGQAGHAQEGGQGPRLGHPDGPLLRRGDVPAPRRRPPDDRLLATTRRRTWCSTRSASASTAETMEKMGYPEHQDPLQGLPPRHLGLPRAEQAVRPGQHHRRRDDPALRGAPQEGAGQPRGERGDAQAHARLRRQGQVPPVPARPGRRSRSRPAAVDAAQDGGRHHRLRPAGRSPSAS